MPAEADAVLRRRDQLKADRSTWDSHWREIADRVLPRASNFNTKRTPGEKRTEEMVDSTAALALERFASALESMLTPRQQRWHHLRASLPDLNEDYEVKAWFDTAEDILFAWRYAPHAAYASQQHETYMSLGGFGTGVLFVGGDEARGGMRYSSTPLSESYIAENQHGIVDLLYRECELSARKAAQKWGIDKLPEAIKKAVEKEPDRKFTFVHAVEPREERDPSKKTKQNMAFAEVWVSEEGRKVVEEGGYRRFPYIVSRYVTAPGEVYGRSPAMTILPDIKMLNEMGRTTIKQAQLAVEPPILVYDDGVLGSGPNNVGIASGYINYGGVSAEGRALMQPFQTGGRVDIGLEMMSDRRKFINDAFLVTLFQILVETPNMTATEAMLRAQEKGALIAPVMGRQQSEALGPMIEREMGILIDQGRLPPLPRALLEAEGEYEIEYDSPLSRAQKTEGGVGIVRTFEMLTPYAAVNPDVFDIFNGDELGRAVADINGVPQKVLNTPEQVRAIRQMRQQAKQMAELLAGAAPAADMAGAIKSVAEANAISNQA